MEINNNLISKKLNNKFIIDHKIIELFLLFYLLYF